MEMYECKVVDIHWQQQHQNFQLVVVKTAILLHWHPVNLTQSMILSEKSESSSAKLNWTYGNILDVNCELWWIVKLGQTVLGNSVCN